MVSTIKMSDFDVINPSLNNSNVGFSPGNNYKESNPPSWTTVGRPVSPVNGFSGYNTDLSQWEYWNVTSSQWQQFDNFSWSTVTASGNAAVNNGYVCNSASRISLLLPATAAVGATIATMGMGIGGWSLVANTGQTIVFDTSISTSGGSISSTAQFNNVTISCQVANLRWQVRSAIGTLTVA